MALGCTLLIALVVVTFDQVRQTLHIQAALLPRGETVCETVETATKRHVDGPCRYNLSRLQETTKEWLLTSAISVFLSWMLVRPLALSVYINL